MDIESDAWNDWYERGVDRELNPLEYEGDDDE